jgi:hypothetical protein
MQELEAELKEKQKDVWQKKTKELFGSTEVSFSKIFTEEMPATSTPPVKPPEVAPNPRTSDSGATSAPAKKTQNGVGDEIIRQPEEVAPNQKPVIKGVTVSQLHFSYNEVPHRYRLMIDVSDPDGNLPLAYTWSISCGYFFGPVNSEAVEWRYDTPGECINARLTIKVADSLGASESLTDYPLF